MQETLDTANSRISQLEKSRQMLMQDLEDAQMDADKVKRFLQKNKTSNTEKL